MSEHSPTPWRIWNHSGENVGQDDGYQKTDILTGSDIIHIRQSVAGQTFPTLSANARFIVLACNHHDELVEALKMAESFYNNQLEHIGDCEKALSEIDIISALLSKIEGER